MSSTAFRSQPPTSVRFLLILAVFVVSAIQAQEPDFLVSGGNDRLHENIQAHVSMPSLPCDASSQRLNRLLPSIRRQVVRAGRALGYYHLTQQTSFDRDDQCWRLQIETVPGDPVVVTNIDIDIADDTELFKEVLNDLPLQLDAPLNQAAYERIKTNLSTKATELGYFSARFDNAQLLIDLEQNTASVQIEFNPGERFTIGKIEIEDTGSLDPDFVARYMEMEQGDSYSSASLLQLRNSLNNSLFFSQVTVTPELDNALNNQVPIKIGLALRPQRAYSAGVGVTTDIGPRIRADYEDRYLTRQGHSVQANGGASPVRSNVDIRYSVPLQKPATESIVFSGGFLTEDTDTFESDTFKLATTYSFSNRFDWRQSYFVDYQHDVYEINDEREVSDLLIPGVNLNRTSADDVLYPSQGWRLFAQLRGASEDLLSPESFAQLNIAGKYITTVGPGRLLLKAEIGTTLVDDISDLPVSIQYFGGGDQSVRGYQYQSLGPINSDGEVVGGKHLLTAGIEYDFFFRPNWKLALFSDAGNAFDSFSDYDLKRSVGVGVRWLSPIGPIRLDLASALDDDNKFRIHITMGPDL